MAIPTDLPVWDKFFSLFGYLSPGRFASVETSTPVPFHANLSL